MTPLTGHGPLSASQHRIWFAHQLLGGGAAYNVPVEIRWRGRMDTDAMAGAWADVIARHEPLRTQLVDLDLDLDPDHSSGTGLAQQVLPPNAVPPLELRQTSSPGRRAEFVRRPFDLLVEPPVRAELHRVDDDHHVLLLVVHHIAIDGASFSPLLRDLAEAYRHRLTPNGPGIEPLDVSYRDYVAWHRELLGDRTNPDGVAGSQLAYWRRALRGSTTPLYLPADDDLTVDGDDDLRGETHTIPVARTVAARLRTLVREERTTLFTVAVAAVAAVLPRMGEGYGERARFCVGTVASGRTEAGLDDLVGAFVNPLALPVHVAASDSFRAVLRQVHGTTLQALANQDVPFDQVVDAVQPERTASPAPLFGVEVLSRDLRQPDVDFPGLTTELTIGSTNSAKSDLVVIVEDRGPSGGLALTLEYRLSRYRPETIASFGRRLELLLIQVADDPDLQLGRADLLGADERSAVLQTRKEAPAAAPRSVVDALEQRAVQNAADVALVCNGSCLDYAELNARVNQLARELLAAGVTPDSAVVNALPRGLDSVVVWLAIIKAGAVHTPLDATYPAERIALVLEDARAAVVFCDPDFAATRLGRLSYRPLVLTSGAAPGRRRDDITDSERGGPIEPDRLSYLVYTSGSTGAPKGVAVTHRAVANLLAHHAGSTFAEPGPAAPRLRAALTASLSFDTSWEGVLAMLAGHELHVIDDEIRRMPDRLVEYIVDEQISMIDVTPTVARHLVAAGLLERASSLRTVMLGGEAVDDELWSRLRTTAGVTAWNYYGPSEFCVEASGCALEGFDRPSIGRPVRDTRVYVLDECLNPVPPGVFGELYLAGANIGRGYWRQPALTAQRFVASPYGSSGERMYRSGDFGRWRADGSLEFRGRADDQVKLRGIRMELGEIENAILADADVAHAVVVVREDDHDQHLVAYIVGSDPDSSVVDLEQRLRSTLAERLPAFMVPSAFVELDSLPLSPNGKLDRAALPTPRSRSRASRPAVSPAELKVAAAFTTVLELPATAGLDDGFFMLGGHSLLAARVVSVLRRDHDLAVSLADVLTQRTVGDLASVARPSGPSSEFGDGDRREVTGTVTTPRSGALSPAQLRLWFLDSLEGPSAVYNVPQLLSFGPQLDRAALRAAVADLSDRHDALRTVLAEGEPGSDPVREVLPYAEARLVLDERSGDHDDVVAAQRVPFDLHAGPPVRAVLFDVGGGRTTFLLLVHHIICDGATADLLISDLADAYARRSTGAEPTPVTPAHSTAPSEHEVGPSIESQLKYWRARLDGAPAECTLPADRSRPARPSYRGGTVVFELSVPTSESLRELARTANGSVFSTLVAAVSALHGRYGSSTDVVLGTSVSRVAPDEADAGAGLVLNSLALRIDLGSAESFNDLMSRAQTAVVGALAHHTAPFAQVVEAIQPERLLARNPVYQVSVDYRIPHHDLSGFAAAGVDCTQLDSDLGVAKVDLAWDFTASADGRVVGALNYASDLFDEATAQGFVDTFVRSTSHLVSHPQHPVTGHTALPLTPLPLAPPFDRSDGELDAGVLPRIAARAGATPQAVAVVEGKNSTTYAELVARVECIGAELDRRGVGPGDVVAVVGERGAGVIATLLAILGRAAVYLPVASDGPIERASTILVGAQARLVMTDPSTAPHAGRVAAAAGGLDLAEICEQPASDAPSSLRDLACSEDVAYILYTSGSTGPPKGAMVTHRGLVNNLLNEAWALGATRGDRVGHAAPLTFDISVWQMLVPLLIGGTVHVYEDHDVRDPLALMALVGRDELDVMQVVPSVLRAALDGWDSQLADRPDLALRTLAVTGEVLPAELGRRWLARFPGVPIVNCYGPTECSDDVTHSVVDQVEPRQMRVPIGDIDPGSRAYVLDSWLVAVPVGAIGELYIGGVSVGYGYWGDAAQTATSFVADPFSGTAGSRMYRTGDLVRLRHDGQMEFVTRHDNQVKINGQRIETGEIERALRAVAGVHDAVVSVLVDSYGLQSLVAHYAGSTDESGAREDLQAALPRSYVPRHLIRLDRMPLSSAGKIDRRALPPPEQSRHRPAARQPTTATERAVWEMFAETLGRRDFGIDEDFFVLGGHSLLAVTVVRRLSAQLGTRIPLALLFEHASPAAMARQISACEPDADGESAYPAERASVLVSDSTITFTAPVTTRGPGRRPEVVVLTGATGFLGAALLTRLLRGDVQQVRCMVRATDDDDARAVLAGALSRYGLTVDQSRVVAVAGDLRNSDFGMSETNLRSLGAECDVVVHCGAQVNLAAPYDLLRPANVHGTAEVLRFVARCSSAPALVHVSTIDTVAGAVVPGGRDPVPESTHLPASAVLGNGYVESKWVGEQMVDAAVAAGVRACTVRPGRISGDTGTGASASSDVLSIFLRATLAIGFAPERLPALEEALAPVDFVADVIHAALHHGQFDGRRYHVLGPRRVGWTEWIGAARDVGHELSIVPLEDWLTRVADAANTAVDATTRDLLAVVDGFAGDLHRPAFEPGRFDTTNTDELVGLASLDTPQLDRAVLRKALTFLAPVHGGRAATVPDRR